MFSLLIFETIQRSTQYKRQRIHQSGVSTNVSLLQSNGECGEKPASLNQNITECIKNPQNLKSLKYLLCMNPTRCMSVKYRWIWDNSLLMEAIKLGEDQAMAILSCQSCMDVHDVNYQNRRGNTALHFAYSGKNTKLSCKLLSVGASPYIYNVNGETPSIYAKGWEPKCY